MENANKSNETIVIKISNDLLAVFIKILLTNYFKHQITQVDLNADIVTIDVYYNPNNPRDKVLMEDIIKKQSQYSELKVLTTKRNNYD